MFGRVGARVGSASNAGDSAQMAEDLIGPEATCSPSCVEGKRDLNLSSADKEPPWPYPRS
jgi:hypothetical protein